MSDPAEALRTGAATLVVNEVFFSIQGEGTRAGRPCAFVRLTGCPLRCVWCDTAYAFHEGRRRPADDVLAEIGRFPARLLCLTGGEPLAQPLAFAFVTAALDAGWEVTVETSGHVDIAPLDGRAAAILDVKTPGSGETGRMHWPNLDRLSTKDEAKFVIDGRADYEWSRDLVRERRLAARDDGALLAGPRRPRPRSARPLDPRRRAAGAAAGPAAQAAVATGHAGGVMEREVAVVCVSGGMDSAVTAALAAREHRLAFLHANYGQRTEAKELACFHALADHMGAAARLVVDFSALRQIGGSSLTDPAIPVREGEPVEGVVPTSYVPFRNAHLLSAAVSWAEVLGGGSVFVGAVWEDSSGYPDCRPGVLPRFRGGGPPRDEGGHGDRDRDPRHRDDEGAHRQDGPRVARTLRADLVLLPGGREGLRPLRVVPPAPAGLPGGGGGRPDSLRTGLVRH